MSLPRESCMKCREESDILLGSRSGDRCSHKFCQSCFRKEHIALNITNTFTCPCCHAPFHYNMRSIEEAILIGEAATIRNCVVPHITRLLDVELPVDEVIRINELNKSVTNKLEAALQLNPTNFYTMYSLFCGSGNGKVIMMRYKHSEEYYRLKHFDYSFKLLEHPTIEHYQPVKNECYNELASIFYTYRNFSDSLKYAKLAYEYCLRSSDHANLSKYKDLYLKSRTAFAKLPPLRFAVGDEVEFLHELESGSEWKLGRVVALYYREREFDISFSAPYRLQLIEDSAGPPPAYAWVKADIDRYVRKVGVRSIEDTRYQARLDAKVAELHRVYYSEEFIQDVYLTLAQDREFVEMLLSVWEVDLSRSMLNEYRLLVMYMQPFVRTDSGYHAPSTEEVIAGIRAFFDPAQLSEDATPSGTPSAVAEDHYLEDIRADIICVFQGYSMPRSILTKPCYEKTVRGLLLRSLKVYLEVLSRRDPSGTEPDLTGSSVDLLGQYSEFTVPLEVSASLSQVSTMRDLSNMLVLNYSVDVKFVIAMWLGLHACLEDPAAGPACECPFVYFFVKFCLDHGTGVPKLALALYDRMNMQLSREFIRCANPTCELNKLDKSTGHVKFKNCSRCKAVIYCSRECQTAHYLEHKTLCREHGTGKEGS